MVGVGAFLRRLCRFKLLPAKWRCLVLPPGFPEGSNAKPLGADFVKGLDEVVGKGNEHGLGLSRVE